MCDSACTSNNCQCFHFRGILNWSEFKGEEAAFMSPLLLFLQVLSHLCYIFPQKRCEQRRCWALYLSELQAFRLRPVIFVHAIQNPPQKVKSVDSTCQDKWDDEEEWACHCMAEKGSRQITTAIHHRIWTNINAHTQWFHMDNPVSVTKSSKKMGNGRTESRTSSLSFKACLGAL